MKAIVTTPERFQEKRSVSVVFNIAEIGRVIQSGLET